MEEEGVSLGRSPRDDPRWTEEWSSHWNSPTELERSESGKVTLYLSLVEGELTNTPNVVNSRSFVNRVTDRKPITVSPTSPLLTSLLSFVVKWRREPSFNNPNDRRSQSRGRDHTKPVKGVWVPSVRPTDPSRDRTLRL